MSKKFLCLSLILLPPVIFFFVFLAHAVNIPLNDDFDVILNFILEFKRAPGLEERLGLILSPHNEHRVVLDRLSALLVYYIKGDADMRWLMFLGNMGLAAVAAMVFASVRITDKALFFIPASFIIFAPQYYEAAFSAMSSISNFYVISFAFLGIYALSEIEWGRGFIIGFLSSLAAAFTQGNGLLAFMIGLGVLLYRRRLKEALLWVAFSAPVFFIFFHGHAAAGHKDLNVLAAFQYLLTFLGAPFYFYAAAGAFCLAFFGVLTYSKYYEKNLAVYAFMVFIIASAALASVSRHQLGAEQALSLRYRINPLVLYALMYVSAIELLEIRKAKRLLPVFAVISAAFLASSYIDMLPGIRMEKRELSYSMVKWGASSTGLIYPDLKRADSIMGASVDEKVFVPDFDLSIKADRAFLDLPQGTAELAGKVETASGRLPGYLVSGGVFLKETDSKGGSVHVVLNSDDRVYVFETLPRKRPDLADHFGREVAGFACYIHKGSMEKGGYRLGVILKKADYEAFGFTGEVLEFK